MTLDGEAVILGPDGHARFHALMQPRHPGAVLVAFDVVRDGVEDVRHLPWTERRARLEEIVDGEAVMLSHVFDHDGATVYEHACRLGLEGIVSKRRDLPYKSGRCKHWVKVRNPGYIRQ